jgi:hypothetical protein
MVPPWTPGILELKVITSFILISSGLSTFTSITTSYTLIFGVILGVIIVYNENLGS